MYYAQLDGNAICIAVTETHTQLSAPNLVSLLTYDTTVLGKKYINGAFTELPPAPAHPIRVITKLDYMNRFTDTELANIYTAAKLNVSVEVWLEKFKLASDINLDDPRTIAGLQSMEAAGLLAAGRATEILA